MTAPQYLQKPNCQLSLQWFPLETGPFLPVTAFCSNAQAAQPGENQPAALSTPQCLDMQGPASMQGAMEKGTASQAWLLPSPPHPPLSPRAASH